MFTPEPFKVLEKICPAKNCSLFQPDCNNYYCGWIKREVEEGRLCLPLKNRMETKD